MGTTFRGGRERFHSDALVLIGHPIRWADLVRHTPARPETVRELTRRIHIGLSKVTANLQSWDDFPLVEGAEAIHEAEFPTRTRPHPSTDSMRWLVRMRRTAQYLQRMRTLHPDVWEPLARDILRHKRVLDVLGLEPRDLHEIPRASVAVRWTLKNVLFFGLALPLAVVSLVVFFPASQLVTRVEPRFDLPPDRRATYRVLAGAVAFGGWILIIAVLLRQLVGWQPALWALVLLPVLGLLTLRIRDRWRVALVDLRRILFLRGRRDLRSRLLERQADLARRIRDLRG